MSEDHELASDVVEHVGAGFASECSVAFEVDILSTDGNFASFDRADDTIEMNESRANQYVDFAISGSSTYAARKIDSIICLLYTSPSPRDS